MISWVNSCNKIIFLCLLFINVSSLKLCLTRQLTSKVSDKFRSYHPHFLHSYSCPTIVTPHILFGTVINGKPIFLIKEKQEFNEFEPQFYVNGQPASDANPVLQLFTSPPYQYMLLLQLENSHQTKVEYNIEIVKNDKYMLVMFEYENIVKMFIMGFRRRGVIVELDMVVGVRIGIRNESMVESWDNWRLSYNVRWDEGAMNGVVNEGKYKGIVMQIEYQDKQLVDELSITIEEIKDWDHTQKPAKILENLTKVESKEQAKDNVGENVKLTCAKSAVKKLFEGLTYEFGKLTIKNGDKNIDNEAKELLSFSPSRKRFPWGFLWDDGFHCEIAVRTDEKLTLEIIESWLDTMLESGWIPREQNRGPEREQLCNCPMFMAKDVRDGNPPTLILALEYLRREDKLGPFTFPLSYWGKLKRWYSWFMTTQRDSDQFLFKWHDSINIKTVSADSIEDMNGASFTSGMDDFPRPRNAKGHVDLQCWMYFLTKFMSETAPLYGESSESYGQNLVEIKKNLGVLFDPQREVYVDLSTNNKHSPHIGYPSILPIAFGMLDYDSNEYRGTIAMVKIELDTSYGLSSIAKSSALYLSYVASYWRGPVWINMNYLFLRGLKLYYPKEKELYEKLRKELLDVVCGNWEKKGHFFENYINGRGSFAFPFNGWTSLIAIMAEEKY